MKFARYLKDTQTPEWKKAYIDYRGLKKSIKTATSFTASSSTLDFDRVGEASDEPLGIPGPSSEPHVYSKADSDTSSQLRVPSLKNDQASSGQNVSRASINSHPGSVPPQPAFQSKRPSIPNGSTPMTRMRTKANTLRRKSFSTKSGLRGTQAQSMTEPLTLRTLLPQLTKNERLFFDKLDKELEKIEGFYLDREKEMAQRTEALKVQLEELEEHKAVFKAATNARATWFSPNILANKLRFTRDQKQSSFASPRNSKISKSRDDSDRDHDNHNFDPETYHTARKALNKALVEHYRLLEILTNYRILNITGFRKALKKFEKTTRIPVQHVYIQEKVDPSALGSGKAVRVMMDEAHAMYTATFTKGNSKQAMKALRPDRQWTTHHFSSYRSGLMMGLAIPALVSGLVNSFHTQVRNEIGPWDGLMVVYGTLLVPVIFSMLIALNILVYAQKRINYAFIFELNLRTRLDYREYLEIPSFLFATLCYTFWLSFAGIETVSPMVWPLVWLALTAFIMFNPLPVLFKSSRYWLLKATGKLFLSGVRRVEFTDFWLGDQFTSMVYTFSNLYFIPCVYVNGFPDDWKQRCGTASPQWPVIFVIATFPFLVRAVQSIKRYVDTGLVTHLINGGKYLCSLLSYLFYFLWRHQGMQKSGGIFVVWCLMTTLSSLYSLSWDILMDWSLCQPHARYRFLRDELVFKDYVPTYYLAMISNAILRFMWIIYIPTKPSDMYLLTFITGTLEVLRRIQWNFYRLENEHLGNVDQYRVSKEVPLPYSFDQPARVGESGDDDDEDDDLPNGK